MYSTDNHMTDALCLPFTVISVSPADAGHILTLSHSSTKSYLSFTSFLARHATDAMRFSQEFSVTRHGPSFIFPLLTHPISKIQ